MRLSLRRPASWRERRAPRQASQRDASQRDASQRDASQRDASQRQASQRDASQFRAWLFGAWLFAASSGAPALVWGQAPADPVILDLSSRVERFLRDVGESPGVRKPFETLLQASLLAAPEKIDPLLAATDRMRSQYGAFVAAEQIGARRVGQDLVLLTYLYKLEKFPVLWRFAYYRPRETAPWTLVSLRFDGKLLELTQDPP